MDTSSASPTANTETLLDRARRVYREYFTTCFWHWRRDLEIAESDIPALVKGLRTNGNRQAYLEADLLSRGEFGRGGDEFLFDWCYDSAFRFFPIEPDSEMGFVLHRADLATNKLLALAARSEIRDYIDILHLHQNELSLGAIAWAACGKDAGFNPESLLGMAKRHVRFRQDDLDRERLREPLNLCDLKRVWIDAVEKAEALFPQLAASEIGCLYLTADGKPTSPDPMAPDFPKLVRHFGSLHGAWPRTAPL